MAAIFAGWQPCENVAHARMKKIETALLNVICLRPHKTSCQTQKNI